MQKIRHASKQGVRGRLMSEAWREVLLVALDAVRIHNHERALELFDELDKTHPDWIFEVSRGSINATNSPRSIPRLRVAARSTVLLLLFQASGLTLKKFGALLDVSAESVRQSLVKGHRCTEYTLYIGGYSFLDYWCAEQRNREVVVSGALEEDFPSEAERRERRRRGHPWKPR